MEQRSDPGPTWVELRVHGVSGTPPEDLLDSAHVVQVGGDEFSRFFRPADAQRRERAPESGHLLEGYHWGKYTSGSWRQGLWLAILPFGIVNASQFMLPRPGKGSRLAHAVCGAMLRLLGLGLTAMLLLGVAVVAMDLTAWQWAPLHDLPAWDRFPGWPLSLAMLVCAAVLAVLYSFGRRFAGTAARRRPAAAGAAEQPPRPDGRSPAACWSDAGAPGPGPAGPDAPGQAPTELGKEEFFTGDTDAPSLRWLHLATGLALVAELGATAAGGGGADDVVRWGGWLLLLLVTAIVAFLGDPEESVTVATGYRRVDTAREQWHALIRRTAPWVAVLSVALLGGSLWLAGRRPVVPDPPGGALPGIDGMAGAVMILCVGALIGLWVANDVLARRTDPGAGPVTGQFRRFAGGRAATLAASVGTFLGVGYAAAFGFGWAWLLGRWSGGHFEISPLLQRIAYAWGLTLFLILALLLGALGARQVRRKSFVRAAERAFTFGSHPGVRIPPSWVGAVAAAMWKARLKNQLEALIKTFAVTGIVLSIVAAVEFFHFTGGRRVSWDLPWWLGGWVSEDPSTRHGRVLIALGTLVLLGLATVLVLLGRGAIQRESLRRGVNVAWDVISFWPRAVHPFVPPPYSQRAVVDLRDRISWHLGGDPAPVATPDRPRAAVDSVVVAAHSQGSLIAFAALLWLPPAQRARVGLLTFGSQLQVQFPRGFPAYVNLDVIDWLFARLDHRWLNLYRDTDAIAGPVLSWGHHAVLGVSPPQSRRIDSWEEPQLDVIDQITGARRCGHEWRLLDPTPYDVALQDGPIAGIHGHGAYWRDRDWAGALDAVRPAMTGQSAQSARSSATG